MTSSTSGSCRVLQGRIRLFIMFAKPHRLSDSFRPSFTSNLNLFSVSRKGCARQLRSGSSLPLKRCLALCVPTNQTTATVYTWLDVNSACTPTSTLEAKHKLLLQLDAIGDNFTNRTFQLQPQSARNSVCISHVCMAGTVSTCSCPISAGFSTYETFLAFAFALSISLGKLTFLLLALSRALPFVLAL